MNILVILLPVSVLLGGLGLAACIWTLRHDQYEDLEGDAARVLLDRSEPGETGDIEPEQTISEDERVRSSGPISRAENGPPHARPSPKSGG